MLRLLLIGLFAGTAAYFGALWATPRVLMDVAMSRIGERAGVNRMLHQPLPDDSSHTVVRPSPDLAYSVCVFDVSDAPVRIDAAIPPGRYWSLSVFGANTDNVFAVNDRALAGKRGYSLLMSTDGRDGSLAVPGGKGIALIRILTRDAADLERFDALRRRSRCGAVSPVPGR